ncbi:MAG: LysR family transcriptional regulator [Bdellovibrionales bacterium]
MRDLNVEQIRKLWILDLIIQSGSLKGAALRARVSPSAISQTLTSLEGALGQPLIIRERGSVQPTPAALHVLEVVRPAFEAFDRLNDLNRTPIPQISWVNFGTYESLAIDILPGLVQSLREKLPRLRLGLRISRTENLLTMVRKGELCSALVSETDGLEKFYVNTVFEDRLGCYVSKKSPLRNEGWAVHKKLGLGSLAPGKSGLPRYYSRFLRQLGAVKPFVQSESFEALRAAAATGVLVAILPERVAQRSDDLVDVTPDFTHRGEHKISVVSQTNCDRDEADFIASESKRLLVRATSHS